MNGAAVPYIGRWDDSISLDRYARTTRFGDEWADLTEIARGRLEGPRIPPEAGISWLAKECVERTIDEWDAVVAVTGKEGVSKSMFSLLFILEVARYAKTVGIDAPWDFRRLCYSGRDVLNSYKIGTLASSIWYDEGARGLLAGETFDPEQIAVVKGLLMVREIGAILVVCMPHIFDLAKKVRGRRATFWVHVESRGTRRAPAPSRAKVHERDDRLKYTPSSSLGLAVSKRCPYLTYSPLPIDDATLLEYRRIKRQKLNEFFDEEDASLTRYEMKKRGIRAPSLKTVA
jgi:hypothetical protein